MEHYVYVIYDPRNGEPFYVGKGKRRRIYDHMKPCHLKKRSYKNSIIKAILAEGFEPRIQKIAIRLSDAEACLLERRLIAQWGRRDIGTGILANMTEGGEGAAGLVPSEKQIHWRKTGRIGKKHSQDSCLKMSEAAKKQNEEYKNGMCRSCSINGLTFPSGSAAMKHFGLSLYQLQKRGMVWNAPMKSRHRNFAVTSSTTVL